VIDQAVAGRELDPAIIGRLIKFLAETAASG